MCKKINLMFGLRFVDDTFPLTYLKQQPPPKNNELFRKIRDF